MRFPTLLEWGIEDAELVGDDGGSRRTGDFDGRRGLDGLERSLSWCCAHVSMDQLGYSTASQLTVGLVKGNGLGLACFFFATRSTPLSFLLLLSAGASSSEITPPKPANNPSMSTEGCLGSTGRLAGTGGGVAGGTYRSCDSSSSGIMKPCISGLTCLRRSASPPGFCWRSQFWNFTMASSSPAFRIEFL